MSKTIKKKYQKLGSNLLKKIVGVRYCPVVFGPSPKYSEATVKIKTTIQIHDKNKATGLE